MENVYFDIFGVHFGYFLFVYKAKMYYAIEVGR
jgi:hypothetical protein